MMKKSTGRILIGLLLVIAILTAQAHAARDYTPDVKIHEYPNGLVLIVVEDHDWPTVLCYRLHRVGSVNEHAGITGSAHLLEHMMFKGTGEIGTWDYEAEKPIMKEIDCLVDEIDRERAKGLNDYQLVDRKKIASLWKQVKQLQEKQRKYIRKNEIDYIYSTNGGRGLNASTGFDSTNYFISLPSNRLEVWAYVESQRMKDPVFREFYSERDVVHEEHRMYANTPGGAMFATFIPSMFHAATYGHPIIGWESDIDSLRRNRVMDFLRLYYAPNNTVLVLVGDVKFDQAQKMVGEYFQGIPRQPSPPPVFTQEPKRRGERRTELRFEASQPRILIGFQGPPAGHPDQHALDVISFILSKGRTSRFYRDLVKKKIAYSASGWDWTLNYTNIFYISAIPRKPHTAKDLEQTIYRELDRLKTEPVSKLELQKVRNWVEKDYLDTLTTRFSLANALSLAYLVKGDWRRFDERKQLNQVTPADVMRVAKKYFTPENRTVITLVPIKKGTKQTPPAPKSGKGGK